MTTTYIVLFACMVLFMILGVPMGICLIFPVFLTLLVNPYAQASFFAQLMYKGFANYTLMAIPFFIMCGTVMEKGGLSRRLVRIADSLVGNFTGSLGLASLLACMLFGAISGSAPSTVAAIGAIVLPAMVRQGYNKYYAVGLITCAGSLGVIVPPSIPMLFYGVTTGTSIGDLFIGGFGPAFIVGACLGVVNYVMCRKNKVGKTGRKFSIKEVLLALKDGWPALLMPIIILGGIYGGIFTATEASVVATVYSLIVAIVYYKEIKVTELLTIFREMATFCGGALLTMGPSSALGYAFTYLGISAAIKKFVFGMTSSGTVVLLGCVVILLIAGMFLDTVPVIVIFAPIFVSVLEPLGVSKLHLGLVMTLALGIAFTTPPVAANLYTSSAMTGIPLDKIVKPMLPFMLALFVALIIVTLCPGTVTWLISVLS